MIRAALIACLTLVALAACGPVHHVFPPAVNIEQLQAPTEGPWTITLRLHNQSYDAGVQFDHVQLDINLAEQPAGSVDQALDLEVAERNSDVASLTFTPGAAARKAVLAAGSSGSVQLHYTIKGTARISSDGGGGQDYPVDHTGWLSPVPGVAHTYR